MNLAFHWKMSQRFYLQLIQRQLPIRKHRLKNMLIVLQGRVAADELQHLLENIGDFFLDLIEDPLIELA